jgi:signal transduction histidine kinase
MAVMKSPRGSFEGLSIHTAVFLGFGLILGLWLFAWIQLSFRISEVQDRAAAITARYMNAQETLSSVRAQVLMASVTFRDALLDPERDNIVEHKRALDEAYAAVDELLERYVPVLNSPAEQEQFARLRAEVTSYRSAMFDVLASDRSRWMSEARDLLRFRVTPRRDEVIAISEGVQTLNRAGYVQQQAQIAELYRSVQSELWQLLGLALAIGIAIAVLAVFYAGRLERRLHRQMAKDLALTRELQELSAKLVMVQEQERRHIARELHDEIGQALTAIKVELGFAQRSIERVAGATNVLHDARSITDGVIHQVRDLSYLLHPAVLDEFGLVPALESYLKTFSKRYGIQAELIHEGVASRLAPETEAAAYRIVQEALTNIAKHAKATTCHVHLVRLADALRITIEDNGAGFDPALARSVDRKGLGLIGIRERASYLQGTVVVDSKPGRGTRLVVELPMRRSTEREDFQVAQNSATVLG